jgi:hypothetical protein
MFKDPQVDRGAHRRRGPDRAADARPTVSGSEHAVSARAADGADRQARDHRVASRFGGPFWLYGQDAPDTLW